MARPPCDMTVSALREHIERTIPAGSVIPEHNNLGHFYRTRSRSLLPSVTGKLQILKDQGLSNWKMNRALEYVFGAWKQFTDETVMDHLDKASKAGVEIFEDAGDIGTAIHSYREMYFTSWIRSGKRPEDIKQFLPPEQVDPRAISGMRALERFCVETGYVPVATELLVYDEKLAVAGTLDDIGLMPKTRREGTAGCHHDVLKNAHGKNSYSCILCPYKFSYELVLMDLKTSNQFKDHYFLQVALYFLMFHKLTGLRPTRTFILKLSKTDGTYAIEEIHGVGLVIAAAKSLLRVNKGLETIQLLRKDNQKVVVTL